MGLPRSLIVLAAASVLPFAVGCASLHEARHTAMQTVGLEAPTPATEFALAWQNKLAQLPDPTKNGATITGLPGQMFLFAPDGDKLVPAVPTGELTISVIDETPRSAGYPKKPVEVFHYSNDKLRQMQAIDERFGKNFVVFLPLDPSWRDVSRLRIKGTYEQPLPGQKEKGTLYAQESLITLDFVSGSGGGSGWSQPGSGSQVGIPTGSAIVNQMRAANQARNAANGTMTIPPTQQQPVIPVSTTKPANPQTFIPVSATNPIQPQSPARPPANPATPNGGMVVPANLP
jgi:hypothetical protein